MPGNTTARGYGYEHRKLRQALLPYAYGSPCHMCGELMLPGQPLALDHDAADRTSYRGMTHARCNSRDGGRRGAAKVNAKAGRGKDRRSWTLNRHP